jgi:hypothetical protein
MEVVLLGEILPSIGDQIPVGDINFIINRGELWGDTLRVDNLDNFFFIILTWKD